MRFTHDCNRDVFLGEFNEYDLYFADHGGVATAWKPNTATVIARFGSEGPEYTGGIALASHCQPLSEALSRAIELSLIEPMKAG